MRNAWIDLSPIEEERTYIFDGGQIQTIASVAKIKVSSSNHHYLETVNGEKWIIPPRWIAIKLRVSDWSF